MWILNDQTGLPEWVADNDPRATTIGAASNPNDAGSMFPSETPPWSVQQPAASTTPGADWGSEQAEGMQGTGSTGAGNANLPTGGSSGGSSGIPKGVDPVWWEAFKQEHGGVDPVTYYKGNLGQAVAEKNASEAWAWSHGHPSGWGNKPGDYKVPRNIFQLLASASGDENIAPYGSKAIARAADDLGGGILAMQGGKYHPNVADPAAEGETLADILGRGGWF